MGIFVFFVFNGVFVGYDLRELFRRNLKMEDSLKSGDKVIALAAATRSAALVGGAVAGAMAGPTMGISVVVGVVLALCALLI